jgi:hypothetical protein
VAGTGYSLAFMKSVMPGAKPRVGDRLVKTRWEQEKARREDELLRRGGAIIDRPDR